MLKNPRTVVFTKEFRIGDKLYTHAVYNNYSNVWDLFTTDGDIGFTSYDLDADRSEDDLFDMFSSDSFHITY